MEMKSNIRDEIKKMTLIKLTSKDFIKRELFWDAYRY